MAMTTNIYLLSLCRLEFYFIKHVKVDKMITQLVFSG